MTAMHVAIGDTVHFGKTVGETNVTTSQALPETFLAITSTKFT